MKTGGFARTVSQTAGTMVNTLALIWLVLCMPAFASLGAPVNSVKGDQKQLEARLQVIEGEKYSIHELTSAQGTVVREYVSQSGTVFAVSWRGPFMPDMRQLLGGYFQQYLMSAGEQRNRRMGRTPLFIDLPSLVLQSSGHMLSYFGRAYDPTLLPTGVNPDELR